MEKKSAPLGTASWCDSTTTRPYDDGELASIKMSIV